jgi:hypothetical protein
MENEHGLSFDHGVNQLGTEVKDSADLTKPTRC